MYEPCVYFDQPNMKIVIGDQTFSSKLEAKKAATLVLSQYKGQRIEVGQKDYSFVEALWKRSPSWVDGYDAFYIGQKGFGIGLTSFAGDGKCAIDWSVKVAISGRNVNTHTMLTQAMRVAIRPQVLAYRGRGLVHCEKCSSSDKIEVDHVVTFRTLMYQWLDQWQGEKPSEFIYTHAGWLFGQEDESFKKGWADYHRVHCRLRFLCSQCHLGVTAETRQSSGSEADSLVEEPESDPRD